MNAYSNLKALRHLDIVHGARVNHPVRPAHVQIILSDLCNHSCDFCAYRDPSYSSSQRFYEIKPLGAALRRDEAHPERNYNPNRMIAYDKAIEILDDCARMGVSAVQFTGGGEPTVHPRWVDIIEAAHERNLKTALVTNGINLSKDARALRVVAECEWVRISIDAATPETYTAMRHVPPSHFECAWRAVRSLYNEVAKRPVVGVGFVVTPANWKETYDAAARAKRQGANNIRIGAQFSTADEDLFAGFRDEAAALAARADRELSTGAFTVFNRFTEKLADLHAHRPDYEICGYQHFTTYIGADLNVYRCCVTAYNDAGLVGSIADRSFEDLWMSQERADRMKAFDPRSCDRCQFNAQNRVLEYALTEQPPMHSEFV